MEDKRQIYKEAYKKIDELEKYNSLDNVGLGTKIIVPISSE